MAKYFHTAVQFLFLMLNSMKDVVYSDSASNELPKLLLISMDGFRYNYLDRIAPENKNNFQYFIDQGVRAKWVENVFPSVTFPNHYTIITGLYPENHGVVENRFYDPVFNETFLFENSNQNFESKWYDMGAEPVYVTNTKAGNGRLSGVVMWPAGLAAVKCTPPDRFIPGAYWINKSIEFEQRIDYIIRWFSDPDYPINLGLLYFEEPDETGHPYGPESEEVKNVIAKLNEVLGILKKKLESKKLLEKINIIITADHGMLTHPRNMTINLDDTLDRIWYRLTGTDKNMLLVQVFPVKGFEDKVYSNLKNYSNLHVYSKDEQALKDLHYNDNRRIMPIILEPAPGYVIGTNDSLAGYTTVGVHGYDPAKVKEMHPFFIASGPAFKKGYSAGPIKMVDLYPLMCHILGIKPAPNNGSLENIQHLLVNPAPSHKADILSVTIVTYILVFIALASVAGVFSIFAVRHSKTRQIYMFSTRNSESLSGYNPGADQRLLDSGSDDEI
ncbi:hypothetical protein CHS0354_035378 [Potamilus streckersoni]|uniref:Uncharacterized protein n=1 Tax=Potamilus streckersoni TaxID=2493646 RepID=A0AAE0TDR9_9BIVA|nr:hypothetical protein CHS0354_035378 [Potamilus streckersoni]